MKNLFFFSFFFLIFLLDINAQPQILFSGLDNNFLYDFGNVSPKQKIISAKVKITNPGTDTLRITDIKPACGCTSTPLDKYTIVAGDTATLTINFRTTGYKGNVKKAVAIYTNIPQQEEMYIFIQCNIVYPISFAPNEYLVFINFETTQHYTQDVSLTNSTDKPITIKDLSISDGNLTVNLKPGDILEPGVATKLSVTFSPTEKKLFHGAISFNTDCEDDPVFRVFIKGMPKE